MKMDARLTSPYISMRRTTLHFQRSPNGRPFGPHFLQFLCYAERMELNLHLTAERPSLSTKNQWRPPLLTILREKRAEKPGVNSHFSADYGGFRRSIGGFSDGNGGLLHL